MGKNASWGLALVLCAACGGGGGSDAGTGGLDAGPRDAAAPPVPDGGGSVDGGAGPLDPEAVRDRVAARSEERVEVRVARGTVASMRARVAIPGATSAEDAAARFLDDFGDLFGVSDPATDLRLVSVEDLDSEMIVVEYERVIGGVPVFGSSLRLHLSPSFELRFAMSELPSSGSVVGEATLALADAGEAAIAAIDAEGLGAVASDVELVVWSHELLAQDGATSGSSLVYRALVDVSPRGERATVLVDAGNGELRFRIDELATARRREVYHAGNLADYNAIVNGMRVLHYDEAGPTIASPHPDATRAYDFAGTIYDYFLSSFGRDSYDGRGALLEIYVQHGTAPPARANAHWATDTMFFDPGMVALDVFTHELTHGVVGRTARLRTVAESGALNEAFADIFAAMVDRDTRWTIGDGSVQGAFRDLANPFNAVATVQHLWRGADGSCPTGANAECGPTRSCPPADPLTGMCPPCAGMPTVCVENRCVEVPDGCFNDQGHVHSNSTIIGYSAYVMSDVGAATDLRSEAGMGTTKLEQIVYRALSAGFLGPTSDFAQLYDAMRYACETFPWRRVLGTRRPDFGIDFPDCGIVINALAELGLGEGDRDFDAVPDSNDDCAETYDPLQIDTDGDGTGDACTPLPCDRRTAAGTCLPAVTGRLQGDQAGNPTVLTAGTQVSVVDGMGTVIATTETVLDVDDQSTFEIGPLPNGSYVLRIERGDLATLTRAFSVTAVQEYNQSMVAVAPRNTACTTDLGRFDVTRGSTAGSRFVHLGEAVAGVEDREWYYAPDASLVCLSGSFAAPTIDWNTAWVDGIAAGRRTIYDVVVAELVGGALQWQIEPPLGCSVLDPMCRIDPPVVYGGSDPSWAPVSRSPDPPAPLSPTSGGYRFDIQGGAGGVMLTLHATPR